MLNNKNVAVSAEDKRKADADEMAKIISKLPDAEREKLFYMIFGIELMTDRMEERRAG